MMNGLSDPHIDFSVAAARMSHDMGLPLSDCYGYAALIDSDFALKLIAFSKATGEKIRVNHGNRPLSYQDSKCLDNAYVWDSRKLPRDGGTILQQCGCWKKGNRNRLAPPGKSPHMCGIAVDVASGTRLHKASRATLKKYGLCKPVPGEPWHIEPILKKRPIGYDRYRLAVSLNMPFVWGKTFKGCVGITVCQIQQALKRLGFFKNRVDGIFGDATEDAVKRFQDANKLHSDGIVGQLTLKALGLNP